LQPEVDFDGLSGCSRWIVSQIGKHPHHFFWKRRGYFLFVLKFSRKSRVFEDKN
jgi:hypothetical protein